MNAPIPFALVTLYERQRVALLEEFPDLRDDDVALSDTLDGVTALPDVLAKMLSSALDDEAMANAITARINDMQTRRSRFERRAEKQRQMVQTLMEHAGMTKLVRPEFTASLRTVPPAVVVLDETALPDEFVKVTRSPNKAALKDALKAGAAIPGATLGNGGSSLAILTK